MNLSDVPFRAIACVASHPDEFAAADRLVRQRYASRGYQLPPEDAPTDASTTLLAVSGNQLLGTLTLRPDSRHGLLVDKTHGASIARLREEGWRLGEVGRLAFQRGVDWRNVLDALVHVVYRVARANGVNELVIEVNPRHVGFYLRAFGFTPFGTVGYCERVKAPSVLMQLPVERLGIRLGDWSDKRRLEVVPGLQVNPIVVGKPAKKPGRWAAEHIHAEGKAPVGRRRPAEPCADEPIATVDALEQ